MASFDDLSFSGAGFSGKVRLFPLPNLVLFPHVMQPLHIFEPRYRQLLEDALADDGLIAMALLVPGWEKDYEGRPPMYTTACLAKVATHHQLEDGTYNLLVLGLKRVRVIRELEPTKPYREAMVELCEEDSLLPEVTGPQSLQRRLRESLIKVLPRLPEAQEQLDQLMAADIPLGVLTDVVSFMLDIGVGEKQLLLSEVDIGRRSQMLLDHLAAASRAEAASKCGVSKCGVLTFPPQFSAN